jgi:hypothetical protein
MPRIIILLFLSNLIWYNASSQVPELNLTQYSENQISHLSSIKKARAYYNNGAYEYAESQFYIALDQDLMTTHDFMLFANTLLLGNKQALAREFYNEYVTRKGIIQGDLLDEINEVFEVNSIPFIPTNVGVDAEITNPTLSNGNLYTVENSRLFKYQLDCDGNLSNKVQRFKTATSLPIGSVSFFNEGQSAVGSIINYQDKSVKLYYFTKKNGEWRKPTELFTTEMGNYAFPFMDENSNTLYFASDKKGGFGNYDLYLSVRSDGSFGTPINLGQQVNSKGNDVYPTKTEEWLYFSSNGKVSNGGYDLYKFKNLSDYNSILANCFEFNTRDDDLSLIPNGQNKYYLYQMMGDSMAFNHYVKPAELFSYIGSVVDEEGLPVKNARILIEPNTGYGDYTITDSRGFFNYVTEQNVAGNHVTAIAKGFDFKSFKLGDSVVVLTKTKPREIIKEVEKIIYKNIIKENDGDTTSVDIINTDNNIGKDAKEPVDGMFYVIVGSSYSYSSAYDLWSKWIDIYDRLEILKYESGLFRVAYYAGSNEADAMLEFNQAKVHKDDLWILRP